MIISARKKTKHKTIKHLKIGTLLILAIATSIDAFAVGLTFNLVDLPILYLATITGLVTFLLSYFGYMFGSKLGTKISHNANAFGGLALILIGIKILLIG